MSRNTLKGLSLNKRNEDSPHGQEGKSLRLSSQKTSYKDASNFRFSNESTVKNPTSKPEISSDNQIPCDKSDVSAFRNSKGFEESNDLVDREKTLNENNSLNVREELTARGEDDSPSKPDVLIYPNSATVKGKQKIGSNKSSDSTTLKSKINLKSNNKVNEEPTTEKQKSRSNSIVDLSKSPNIATSKKLQKIVHAHTASVQSAGGVPKTVQDVVLAAQAAKSNSPIPRNTSLQKSSSSYVPGGPMSGEAGASNRPSASAGGSGNMAFARDFANNKVKTSNVKVVARIRPINKMEAELKASGVGNECVIFPSENQCAIMPENHLFTLDRFFKMDCNQKEIYDFLGKETIEDVLSGYNGTIFAYGQTGSGKTHTMYGVMHDPELKGVIPRASEHIFEYIASIDEDVDISLKCSMLEIYKENLYDLFAGDKMVGDKTSSELKIKENPRRGIYVEGLNEEDVSTSEELMELLELGDKQRTVAATRMNNYSSRSHSLFIIEIIQKFPNEAEKRGKLNLVDLAGSEKIGKTGATGDTLEEAKKINLSLSSLGFVIHALTSNYEHIPYRDSKLTRILQESLGGNYKTALIVACSPYSSNKEETIGTLKFAARAKTIKNQYKMNIQNSPETLMAVIESLKIELDDCRLELSKYKEGGIVPGPGLIPGSQGGADFFQRNWSRFRTNKDGVPGYFDDNEDKSNYEDFQRQVQLDIFDPKANMEKIKEEYAKNKTDGEEKIEEIHNKGLEKIISDSLTFFKGRGVSESAAQVLSMKIEEAKNLYHKKDYNSYSYYKTNLELLTINESLEIRLNQVSKEFERLINDIADKETRIKEQDDENVSLKNQLLDHEKQISILTEQNYLYKLKIDTKSDSLDNQKLTIEVLEKQIMAITEALSNSEQSIETLLSEKSRLVNSKFQQFMMDDAKFKEIKLPDYFIYSYNFNFEPFYDQVPPSQILNPNYNEHKFPSQIQQSQASEEPLYTIESHTEERDDIEEDRGADERIPDEKASHMEKSSHMEKGSHMAGLTRKSSLQLKDSFISNLDLQKAFNNASNNLREVIEVPYAVQSLLNKLSNGGVLRDALEEQNNMSAEFVIYILKQQLLQTCIINQHLERTIAALEWKQIIEYGKAKIKSNYTKMQERHIANLEKVLDKSRLSHEQLRKRVEDVELEAIRLRETVLNVGPNTFEGHTKSLTSKPRARILKSVKHENRRMARLLNKEGSTNILNQGQGGAAAGGPNNTSDGVSIKNEGQSRSNLIQTNEVPSYQRLQTETESHDQSENLPKREQRNFAFSFAGGISPSRQTLDYKASASLNDQSVFVKEIENEIKTANGEPNSIDEAKLMLNLRSNIITKLKNYILHSSAGGATSPGGLVNAGSGFSEIHQNLIQYLKYENDRLENKLLLLQTDLDVEKTRSEQIKDAYNEQKKQMTKLNHLNTELEIAGRNALKKENEAWQKIIDEFKTTHVKEMVRKQEEVTKLHDLLAGWVFRYMELQEAKNIVPTHQEKMLFETFKRREFPPRQLLEKALNSSKIGLDNSAEGSPPKPKKTAPERKTVELNLSGLSNSPLKSKRQSRDYGNFYK